VSARFEDALGVSPLDDGRNWAVLEDFYYDTDVLLAGLPAGRVRVEKGFVTDFASIPRAMWPVVGAPAEGKFRKIAVVHDKLYRTKGLATRAQADAVLLEGMRVSGCPWRQRTAIYLAVRMFGGASYRGGL
jgi:hypothetical protein